MEQTHVRWESSSLFRALDAEFFKKSTSGCLSQTWARTTDHEVRDCVTCSRGGTVNCSATYIWLYYTLNYSTVVCRHLFRGRQRHMKNEYNVMIFSVLWPSEKISLWKRGMKLPPKNASLITNSPRKRVPTYFYMKTSVRQLFLTIIWNTQVRIFSIFSPIPSKAMVIHTFGVQANPLLPWPPTDIQLWVSVTDTYITQ